MNLRTVRKTVGLTQQQLADKSGIHRVTVARIESENHTTTMETAAKLAAALGCTIDELMRGPAEDAVPSRN
jgi:putative transcriptional regulator